MVDITSLKVRLARLRLAGSKSKEVAERIRNRRKPIEEEEELQTRKATKDPYNEYTKNTGGKRKKNNKLTRSDQKRGKKVIKKKKIKLDADDYVRSHTPSNVIKQGPDYYPDST